MMQFCCCTMLPVYVVVCLLVGNASTATVGSSRDGGQSSCSIPAGRPYELARFTIVYSEHRNRFPETAFDGNWNFLPSVQVPDSILIRVFCEKDIYGDAIHAVHYSTCRKGTWEPHLPDCFEKFECGMFPYFPALASERRRPGTTYPDGHIITFRCHGGEQLVGNNSIVCRNGVWSNRQFSCRPAAVKGSCPRPSIPFAYPQPVLPGFGEVPSGTHATFSCVPGRQLVGENRLVCTDGEWSPVRFICEKIQVAKPCTKLEVEGAEIIGGGLAEYKTGNVVNYRCVEGRILSGNSAVVCTNGQWSDINFKCESKPVPRTCTKLKIEGGEIIGDGPAEYSTGSVVNYRCVKGRILSGNGAVVCTNGQWSDINFKCEPKPARACQAQQIENAVLMTGSPTDASFPSGSRVTYKCAPGTRLTGNSTVICQNGIWSNVKFSCDMPSTVIPPEPCVAPRMVNAIMDRGRELVREDGTYPSGTAVNFRCSVGERLTGDSTVVCNEGRWSPKKFECKKMKIAKENRQCRRLNIGGATPDVNRRKFDHGSAVQYRCMSGRVMIGTSDTVKCRYGWWSSVNFYCAKHGDLANLGILSALSEADKMTLCHTNAPSTTPALKDDR